MRNKTNATKERIIIISKKLFDEKGFDKVTLNEICKTADISKHTFYYYFESKEDILKKFYSSKSEINAKIMMDVMNEDFYIEKMWILIEKPLKHLITMGPEVVKRMFIAQLTSAMPPIKEHLIHSEIREIELKFIKEALINKEINNNSDPNNLLSLMMLQTVALIEFWAILDGKDDLIKNVRIAFENCLDIRADLRKAKDECFKSKLNL